MGKRIITVLGSILVAALVGGVSLFPEAVEAQSMCTFPGTGGRAKLKYSSSKGAPAACKIGKCVPAGHQAYWATGGVLWSHYFQPSVSVQVYEAEAGPWSTLPACRSDLSPWSATKYL